MMLFPEINPPKVSVAFMRPPTNMLTCANTANEELLRHEIYKFIFKFVKFSSGNISRITQIMGNDSLHILNFSCEKENPWDCCMLLGHIANELIETTAILFEDSSQVLIFCHNIGRLIRSLQFIARHQKDASGDHQTPAARPR